MSDPTPSAAVDGPLPCPFCGIAGSVWFIEDDAKTPREFFVECAVCKATGQRTGQKATAIVGWNRRRAVDTRVAALEQERDKLKTQVDFLQRNNDSCVDDSELIRLAKERDLLAAKLSELQAIAEGLADNIRNRQRSNCPSCGRSRYGNRRSCECGFYFVRYESLAAFTEWKERNP